MLRPNMKLSDQPGHSPERISRSPSTNRRGTARINVIVMSAVSSVSTPGVLVTVMPCGSEVDRVNAITKIGD
jgi:hypothetical protein